MRKGPSQGSLGFRRGDQGQVGPQKCKPVSPSRGMESSPGSRVEVLGRANHLNGRRLLRDRLYSLIEFALKCNLIFSEAVSSPFATLPQTALISPASKGEQSTLSQRKEERAPPGSAPLGLFTILLWKSNPNGAWPPAPALDGGAASLPGFPLELPVLSDNSCSQLPNPHHEGRFFP